MKKLVLLFLAVSSVGSTSAFAYIACSASTPACTCTWFPALGVDGAYACAQNSESGWLVRQNPSGGNSSGNSSKSIGSVRAIASVKSGS